MNNILKIILVIISCFLVIQHTVFANQTKKDGSGLLWFGIIAGIVAPIIIRLVMFYIIDSFK